jgi:hypothetical protein
MKKVLLPLLLAAFLLPPLAAEPKASESPANSVSVDLLGVLINWYKVSYERRIMDEVSLIGTVQYTPDLLWGFHTYDKVSYTNLAVGGRYYWGSLLKEPAGDVDLGSYSKHVKRMFTDALGGFYIGLTGTYSHAVIDDSTDNDYVAKANAVGLEAELGCKYLFSEKKLSFFFEPYIGGRLLAGSYSYEDGSGNSIDKPTDFNDGISSGVIGGINVGLTF